MINNINNCASQMHELYDMAIEGSNILRDERSSLDEFGKLLNEAWKSKKSLSNDISNHEIDELYNSAMRAGAFGGKILGAGGGGFILFFVKPQFQKKVKKK